MMPSTTNLALPYPSSTAAPNVPSDMQALANAIDAIGAAWTSYTPAWTAASTSPTLGNGTLTGKYRTVGKTMSVRIELTWGSTTTSTGAGNWRFSFPAAPVSNSLLTVYVDDSSASARWTGAARIISAAATGDNMRIVVNNATISGNTSPMTWATSDVMILHGTIELA